VTGQGFHKLLENLLGAFGIQSNAASEEKEKSFSLKSFFPHISERFPIGYWKVESEVQVLKNSHDYFPWSKFALHMKVKLEIENDHLREICMVMHECGTLLLFDKLVIPKDSPLSAKEPSLVIFNPSWLADAFKCIINHYTSEKSVAAPSESVGGILSDKLLTKLWEAYNFRKDVHDYLKMILYHFEIAFSFQSSKSDGGNPKDEENINSRAPMSDTGNFSEESASTENQPEELYWFFPSLLKSIEEDTERFENLYKAHFVYES